MKLKKNNIKIIISLLLIGIFIIATSTVTAAITAENGNTTTKNTIGETITSQIMGFLSSVGNIAITGVGAFITPLINLLSAILLLLLQTIFSVSAGGTHASPWPDWVVFNKIPLLDANFINPHEASLITKLGQGIFIDLFVSFQVIAQALFIIAAMITGLKLATTTIAAKKAQYKEAISKWIFGFIILFCLKWILAGIFYLNELLVSALATSSFDAEFGVKVLNFSPVIGRTLNFLSEFLANTRLTVNMKGFWGMVNMLYAEGAGGNIIASIAAFVIIGQSFVVLGSYLKRLFTCIMLGVLSPIVVAVDTIIGITGGKSTVFKTWLKNFIFTVFTQSFHAAYMAVALRLISNLWGGETSFQGKYMETIVTIFLITGLVKLEKTLKGIFGMGESMAGALSDGSKGMKKALQSAAGLAAAGKAIGDNANKLKDARARKTAINNEQARLKAELANQKSGKNLPSTQTVVNNNNINNNGGSNNGNGKEKDYLQSVLEKERKQPQTIEEKLQVLGEAEAKARADEKSAKLASIMSIPNLAAGIGMGIGMGDDIGETLLKGGLITAGLDKATEKIGYRMADKDRKSLAKRETRDGEDYGYTPSSNIRRGGRPNDATFKADVEFNVEKLGNELKKQFKDVGYVFTDQVKREMKKIDRDLNNEKGG